MARVKGISDAVQTTPFSGEEFAKQGEKEAAGRTGLGLICYRCRKNAEKYHAVTWYCTEFSSYVNGRWLLWDNIRKVLEEEVQRFGYALSWWYSSAMEDVVGAAGCWHRVVGVAVAGHFLGRFESPHQPEFSIIYHDPELDRLPSYRDLPDPNHEYIYMGWRGQLRSACSKAKELLGLPLDFQRVANKLGVSGDRTGEEVTRYQVGWV